MSHKTKLILLAIGSVVAISLFLFIGLTGNWQYILERRFTRIVAIAVTGAVIAIATIIFQTLLCACARANDGNVPVLTWGFAT